MTYLDGEDNEQQPIKTDPEDKGGPETGNYDSDPNMPIPGETEAIGNSDLG